MKKRVLLVALMVVAFACLFAISVSAEITTYDDAPERTVIQMNDDEYVVFNDGFSCPSYYIIPDQTQLKDTDYSYLEKKTGKTYTDADVVEMHVPTGIVDMYKRFGEWKKFENCTVVGVPSTATPDGQFGSKSTVTKVYLPDELTSIPMWCFAGSTTLEEIIISKNSKLETICGGAFQNCNSLRYLYLPEGFKHFDNDSGKEPFVNFGSTNFGFINSPDETTIPEIYYFPSTFEYTENFLWGSRLTNRVIVLPESVTAITGQYDIDNTSVQCIVLLSDKVTGVNLWNASAGQTIYLPNMSSSDFNGDFFNSNNTEITSTVTGKTYTPSFRRGGKQYYYFGVDKKWTCSEWSNNLQKSGFRQFSDMSASNHLDAYITIKEADCLNASVKTVTCLCGFVKSNTTEGSPLGHNHNVYVDMVYSSYQKDGYYIYKCERCDDTNNGTVAPAIFKCLGYSTPIYDGDSLTIGFLVNNKALDEYMANTGKTIKYGVFAANYASIDGTILDDNGKEQNGAIKAEVNIKVTAFDLILTGFEKDEHKIAKLAMGAYVIATDAPVEGDKTPKSVISYMQYNAPDAGYEYITYNDVLKKDE